MEVALKALGQEAPRAKAPVTQQHIPRTQAVPECLQESQFMLMEVSGGPGCQQASGQA
jgi:hypothetical protein